MAWLLDVYLAGPGGGFSDSPRSTAFTVENCERSFVEYGRDLNGNGFSELLFRDQGDADRPDQICVVRIDAARD